MKVLFISAILPYPLHSGGQVRMYNLLKHLSKMHEITLFSFIRNPQEKEYRNKLSFLKEIRVFMRGRVWQPKYMWRCFTSSLPLLLSSYENRNMQRALLEEIENNHYDLLHIEPFYVSPSLPQSNIPPLVIGEHNIEYEVYDSYVKQFPVAFMRPFMQRDVQKIQRSEESMWQKAKKVISVSDHDASIIKKSIEAHDVSVVPNGVDTTHFSFKKRSFDKDNLHLLFVGNFFWMPNVKALEALIEDIWPVVKETLPHADLSVVGKGIPKRLLQKLKKTSIAYKPSVDEICREYEKADVLLAPMTIAGGTKFKVLEAMASGCLVISSKEGVGGLPLISNTHYLEANSSDEIVCALKEVCDNREKAQRITKSARELIETRYDWKKISDIQSSVWESI